MVSNIKIQFTGFDVWEGATILGCYSFILIFPLQLAFPCKNWRGGAGVLMFAGCKNTCELQEGIRRELKTLKKSQSELFQIHNLK